jgi:aryl-alcohol dehydrogenase-like predicted oxidoreductase
VDLQRLGESGLWVSEVGLGTNNFGTRLDEGQARKVLNAALERGITLIDTADMYGNGSSETLLGKTLGSRRHDVVLATKVGKPMGKSRHQTGLSRRWIVKAIENSLGRLGTDYIDLYQLHEPDPDTPLHETIGALDDLVKAGKVRHVGTSNFAAWQLLDADWTARTSNQAIPVSGQYVYNLLEGLEAGILAAMRRLNLGLIAARPLAYGFLTGKFQGGAAPAGARLPESMRAAQIMTPANFKRLERLEQFAAQRGRTILELALAYLLTQEQVTSVIFSASSEAQLLANLAASAWRLSGSEMESIDKLSAAGDQ